MKPLFTLKMSNKINLLIFMCYVYCKHFIQDAFFFSGENALDPQYVSMQFIHILLYLAFTRKMLTKYSKAWQKRTYLYIMPQHIFLWLEQYD